MKNILMAFSGGLDTSYCTRLLANDEDVVVTTVFVNTGGVDSDSLEKIRLRALECGASKHVVLDCRRELYDSVLKWCIAGNVLRNGTYPLSVSAERTVQATAVANFAIANGITHLAHGSTGAGNDQIRFDMMFRILCPNLPVITPIRDSKITRSEASDFLKLRGVPVASATQDYSINQGLWGTTIGGCETLTSDKWLPDSAWPSYSVLQSNARAMLTIGFMNGEPVSLNGSELDPITLIEKLNSIGHEFSIGRGMHVGDTIIGIKGRVAFEAPAAMMIIAAHHQLEKHVLSHWQLHIKEYVASQYGYLLHSGHFAEPAMRAMESFFSSTQERVSGLCTLALSPERFFVTGISSPFDMLDSSVARYGEENLAWSAQDARGYAIMAAIGTAVHKEVSKC